MPAEAATASTERSLDPGSTQADLEILVGRLQGVADPTRARILNVLVAGELCVCDIVELLGLPQPTVSRHLGTLRELGWVTCRRVGRFAHYALADPAAGIDIAPEGPGERPGGPDRYPGGADRHPGGADEHLGALASHLADLVEALAGLPGLDAERRSAARSAARRREEPCR